ncbi:uncharacterized protein LOC113334072 [Papaver somniferum]|uniref:uncharacterized protein LOC113334072 n=1 Tax=Papaver somniferum TaxID=3469 RepID=UPI000E6F62AF|nr:uncharacterized protein LOC113334072 [Papaver somniferum]
MTPFTALYGYTPSYMAFPLETTSSVTVVEDYLKERSAMLDILQENLSKSQERMKIFADKKRTDRSFEVGDYIFLKMQPYRQSSMDLRRNLKLSIRYYGPFQVTHRIGKVAYRLALPATSKIHPVFHVSQLKKKIGLSAPTIPTLPLTDAEGEIILTPVATLNFRQDFRQDSMVPQVLIQWSHTSPEDATWKDVDNVTAHFPKFNL